MSDDHGGVISRHVRGSEAHDTVDIPTVEVYFQKSPVQDEGRGIEGLEYKVVSGGDVLQEARTGADGKIEVQVRGGESTLQLLHDGSVVSEYRVTIRSEALEAVTDLEGQQRRLRMLGYHLGSAGPVQNGVDGTLGRRTDRSILEFQADQSIEFDGRVGSVTRTRLTNTAGG